MRVDRSLAASQGSGSSFEAMPVDEGQVQLDSCCYKTEEEDIGRDCYPTAINNERIVGSQKTQDRQRHTKCRCRNVLHAVRLFYP